MESKARRKDRKRGTPKGRGPKSVSRPESRLKKASLFMNGRSQAVRLPKEFRFEGTHVFVKRDGNRVILMPEDDRMERLIAAMGSAPNFPDIPRDPPEPMRPALKELFGISD
jgi:antitoxin VapB